MRGSAALCGLILACAGARSEPSPPTNPQLAVRSSTVAPCGAQSSAQGQVAELRLQLRPVHDDAGGVVEVTLDVTAPAAELRSWRVPRLSGALEVRVTALEGCGNAPGPQRLRGGAGELLAVAVPQGSEWASLRLEYSVPPQQLEPPYWRLEPDWFLARGHRLLLLPEARGWSADVLVEIDASGYGAGARGVSSLGLSPWRDQALPPRPLRMTVPALEHALFGAGKLSSAQFIGREGRDDAAWFGATMFDVRLLAAEVASFRTAVREVLLDGNLRPLTLILMSDLQHGFEAQRAPISVLVRIQPGERLSAGLRLGVLQQVLKEWIGGRLSVQDEHGVEPLWFSEGLSRYLARELALEFGLISPEEFAADVNALMAMQAVLERHECARAGSAGTAAQEDSAPACARVLQAARGILHATQLDTELHARRSSLVELLSSLLQGRDGPLTIAEWRAALAGAGGPEALRVHEAFLAAGEQPLLLASNAFGACFVREPARYAESLLGLQLERPASGALRISAVEPASPAAAAGLRPGLAVQLIEHVPFDAQRPIRVLLEDGTSIEYRGAEARVRGHAWRRVAGVKDDRCRMSGREYRSR